MASQGLKTRLERMARATAAKLAEKSAILREYERELEQVGPAPGSPWEQHDTMVRSDISCSPPTPTQPDSGGPRALRGCSEGAR